MFLKDSLEIVITAYHHGSRSALL